MERFHCLGIKFVYIPVVTNIDCHYTPCLFTRRLPQVEHELLAYPSGAPELIPVFVGFVLI